MLRKFANFCYDQVGSFILPYVEYFEGLRPQLSMANIEVSLPEYIAMMAFSTLAASTTSLIFLGIIMTVRNGIAGLLMAITVSIIIAPITIVGFYLYPSLKIKNRATKIRDSLPFATMYLSTLAGTGTSLPEIFKNLSEVEEYGEVSKEAEKIHRDIETFGMDITEALQRAAERTPSDDFEELIWGINHTITTGGSLREFLKQRSGQLMDEYERRVREFADNLSLLVEMYITVVVVGSIIFTSMSAVMSSFTSMEPSLIVTVQLLAIFVGLPLVSGMFIIVVQGMAPGGID